MARVTIEECLKTGIENKFELVLIASERTKELRNGVKPSVPDNVKDTLMSLIEIENGTVDIQILRDKIVESYRKMTEHSVEDDDSLENGDRAMNIARVLLAEDEGFDEDENIADEETDTEDQGFVDVAGTKVDDEDVLCDSEEDQDDQDDFWS